MNQISILLILILSFGSLKSGAESDSSLKPLSMTQLEHQLVEIEAELSELAAYSLRSGVGAIGYRSSAHGTSENKEWVEIKLEELASVDEIVMVPTIWRDSQRGFQAECFPLAFSVFAGTAEDKVGQLVAKFGPETKILPRIAPFKILTPGLEASWIRIETEELSRRPIDGLFVLQLSEVMIFRGSENIALKQPVLTSSNESYGAWDRRFLVDGSLPYIMDAATGRQSVAYLSRAGIQPPLIVDLGKSFPLSRIHLHAVDQSDTVPQAHAGDLGIPHHILIEGSDDPDFSQAKLLVDHMRQSEHDTSPIMMWRFPETSCRFIRITAQHPDSVLLKTTNATPRIGFAEIELFSGGRNVAHNQLIRTNLEGEMIDNFRSLSALTDGHNLYGEILPVRQWINQLARRRDLETARPLVIAELNQLYAKQKTNLTRLKWLIAALAAGIIIVVLVDRIVRMRQVAKMKERFAADLHDELGANLHTIGLLSDLAEESAESPEELSILHQRIRNVTERTGIAMRHCANLIEASSLDSGLRANFERASRRILAKLENSISITGEEHLEKLSARTRFDLFLFFNECLVNISRHAEATQFSTELRADSHEIKLSVSDNGRGIFHSKVNGIPKSLKRRARLLGAKLNVDSPENGGTRINLQLRTRKWGRYQ